MNIVIDQAIPFINGCLEAYARVSYLPGDEICKQHLLHAELLIIRTRTLCDANLLEGTSVRYIFTATIGTDHIDLEYCRNHGIEVKSAAGCNVGGVAQYVLTCMARYRKIRSKQWSDLTLGIVGLGNVGSKVEQYARALQMKILRNDPPKSEADPNGNYVSLQELLTHSDIVSFHTPLSKEGKHATYEFLTSEEFNLLRENSLFINTSRGDIIANEQELIEICQQKNILFALDVWKNEPDINLNTLEAAWIATPHIAGYSMEGKWNASQMALDYFTQITCCRPIQLSPLHSIVLSDELAAYLPESVWNLYPIEIDDHTFRNSPKHFERMRNNYVLRREFGAYQVSDQGDTLNTLLSNLDFKLLYVAI